MDQVYDEKYIRAEGHLGPVQFCHLPGLDLISKCLSFVRFSIMQVNNPFLVTKILSFFDSNSIFLNALKKKHPLSICNVANMLTKKFHSLHIFSQDSLAGIIKILNLGLEYKTLVLG